MFDCYSCCGNHGDFRLAPRRGNLLSAQGIALGMVDRGVDHAL